jgi:arginyl-tRNA synthetase
MVMFEERAKESNDKVQVEAAQLEATAEKLGISAIKYYDLRQNRIQNYVFSFDKMLDPKGNTGVYLLYMYVRMISIMEKSQHGKPETIEAIKQQSEGFKITNSSEKGVALAILRLPEQLELAIADLQINRVCDLVYEIATKISEFYHQSKVLGSDEEISRILLLEATVKVMAKSFEILGMQTIDKI